MEHGDDVGIDDPIPLVSPPSSTPIATDIEPSPTVEEPAEIELYPEMNEALVAEVLSFGFPEVMPSQFRGTTYESRAQLILNTSLRFGYARQCCS